MGHPQHPSSYPASLTRLAQAHIEMRQILAELERVVQSVAEYRAADADALARGVRYFTSFAAACHQPVEDAIYEALKSRAPAAADQAACIGQHERLDATLSAFATMTRNLLLDAQGWRIPFCAAGRDFIGLKREHIREEENVLFPLAREHLTADDWAGVDLVAVEAYGAWAENPANAEAGALLGLNAGRATRASDPVHPR